MITTLQDAEEFLAQWPAPKKDFSERLEFVSEVLTKLDNPQNATPTIHIAGTSGKGSTAYYAAALLRESGYSVGLAVSPHVNSVAERSQVNGAVLPDETYVRYFNQFADVVNTHGWVLTYIEFLTIFTFWLFAELQLDYAVIEVGMGGRLDPTNVITRPDTVRVITDIGLDHTEILGDTLSHIALEKAGIIHAGDAVVIHPQDREVMRIVQDVAQGYDAKLVVEHLNEIKASSLPAFQQRNWTLARRAVEERLRLDGKDTLLDSALAQSLKTLIPGRFETFEKDGVTIILDAAHNPQKLTALTESVQLREPGKKHIFVVAFGVNKRAQLAENLHILLPHTNRLIVTSFTAIMDTHSPYIPPEEVKSAALSVGFSTEDIDVSNDPYNALDKARRRANEERETVIVTGSFYLIDGIRRRLIEK